MFFIKITSQEVFSGLINLQIWVAILQIFRENHVPLITKSRLIRSFPIVITPFLLTLHFLVVITYFPKDNRFLSHPDSQGEEATFINICIGNGSLKCHRVLIPTAPSFGDKVICWYTGFTFKTFI